MKKWISTLLTVSLVVSMAAVLHACGKPKDGDQTTQKTDAVPAGESVTAAYDDQTDITPDDYLNELYDLEGESLSAVEITTDEHYQEEYEKLTLPQAVTTQPVAGTTRPQSTTNPAVRSTTEQFQFTYSSQTTRASSGSSGTTKASSSTTTAKDQQTSASDTTVMQEVVAESNVGFSGDVKDVSGVTRPQVTYMDRYVKNILDSGVYTLEAEIKGDGVAFPFTTYTNGTDVTKETSISGLLAQEADLPLGLSKIGKVRMVVKNANSASPHAYIVIPSLNSYIDLNNDPSMQGAFDAMEDMDAGTIIDEMLMLDYLEYYGKTSGVGYVCETYLVPGENAAISFYFAEVGNYRGVVKCEVIDTQTNRVETTMEMRLYDKVTNKNAFNISGKQIKMSDLEGTIGG